MCSDLETHVKEVLVGTNHNSPLFRVSGLTRYSRLVSVPRLRVPFQADLQAAQQERKTRRSIIPAPDSTLATPRGRLCFLYGPNTTSSGVEYHIMAWLISILDNSHVRLSTLFIVYKRPTLISQLYDNAFDDP